jgi:hypothetical protein
MSRVTIGVLGVLGLALAGVIGFRFLVAQQLGQGSGPGLGGLLKGGRTQTYTVESTQYDPPPRPADEALVDDRIEDKKTEFDPDLVLPEPRDGWRLNLSDAVFRLDVPMVLPDAEGHLLELHPSYAAAVRAVKNKHFGAVVLPSVNMIDGKAKQFDDGLYAALDLAYYQGLEGKLKGHVDLFARMLEKVGPDSPAAPFLAAGLTLAGRKPEGVSAGEVEAWIKRFESNPVQSKPIGVYTWSPALEDCFRVLRFYQQPFRGDMSIPKAVAEALKADPELRADYEAALKFYAKLTNPLKGLSFADMIDRTEPVPALTPVSLLPPSVSRESELFEKLFPLGLPPNVDLMRELVRRIRSGEVDLTPRPDSGWYDHQVYALQTLLLPQNGRQNAKLLLTKAYKERMLEAFKALMTKRRETHVRQLDIAMAPTAMAPPPLKKVTPRLRLEPNATYYLRTARAYSFLADFLESTLGTDTLASVHGLRREGEREADLAVELAAMRDLFYGCYLIACEDIGMRPEFADGETVDREASLKAAADWLKKIEGDADLAVDTRVSVPVFADLIHNKTKLWATLGVRLAKLDVSFVRPPRARPAEGEGEWQTLRPDQLGGETYFIPVDEFAEVEVPRLHTFTRDEFRAICDQQKTKDKIVEALSK